MCSRDRQLFRRLVGLVLVAGCSGATPTFAQSAEDNAAFQKFVGIWRLVEWPQRLADGTMRQNRLTSAYIIYTDTGHMCFVAMNPNRPQWKAVTPTPDEALSGIAGLGAYCATVEVHARDGFIVHHVEIERSPNYVGRDRKRWFTFEGPDRVRLRIDPPELVALAPVTESTLVWERVKKSIER